MAAHRDPGRYLVLGDYWNEGDYERPTEATAPSLSPYDHCDARQ